MATKPPKINAGSGNVPAKLKPIAARNTSGVAAPKIPKLTAPKMPRLGK